MLIGIILGIMDSVLSRKFLVKKGQNVEIRRNCYFDRPRQVIIGDGSFVNRNCQFHLGHNDTEKIVLGKHVFVGMNVSFICVSHQIGDSNKRAGNNVYKSIRVNDGAWIGANSTILSGVEIGKGSIVAAGSVVKDNVGDNCMVGGVPSRLIKKL